MSSPEPTLIAINRVRADRADDFEAWLRTVVAPAERKHTPHLVGRWRALRSTEVEDGVVVFAFVFSGGTEEDWELQPLLERALGVQGAERALADMRGMLTEDQYGWSFSDVRLNS